MSNHPLQQKHSEGVCILEGDSVSEEESELGISDCAGYSNVTVEISSGVEEILELSPQPLRVILKVIVNAPSVLTRLYLD